MRLNSIKCYVEFMYKTSVHGSLIWSEIKKVKCSGKHQYFTLGIPTRGVKPYVDELGTIEALLWRTVQSEKIYCGGRSAVDT